MMLTLKTERLILRPLASSDQDALVDAIMSDMNVMRWLPYSDKVSTPQGQREVALGYITEFIRPWEKQGFGVWAVCIRDSILGRAGKLIGYCGFIPEQIEGAGPEIAYALRTSMWGKGLVTEALGACLDWIFSKPEVSRVYAVTDEGNFASRNVMEKTGMRQGKGVDLYDSVAKGEGLLPFYSIERRDFYH